MKVQFNQSIYVSPQGPPGPLGPPGPVTQYYSSQLSSDKFLNHRANKPDFFPSLQDILSQLLGMSPASQKSHPHSSHPHSTSYCLPLFTSSSYSTGLHRQWPAHNCHHVRVLNTSVEDGFYWVDPNLGCSSDAVQVFCRFSSNETCIYPKVCVRVCVCVVVCGSVSGCGCV